MRSRILKPLKNPECKIPKIPKSRGSGLGFENPEKIPSEKSRKFQNLGIGIYFFGISRGQPELVAPKSQKTQQTFEIFNGNLEYFQKIKEKILGFHDFLTIGIFSGFSDNPQNFLSCNYRSESKKNCNSDSPSQSYREKNTMNIKLIA